jgi:hypothetical protein
MEAKEPPSLIDPEALVFDARLQANDASGKAIACPGDPRWSAVVRAWKEIGRPPTDLRRLSRVDASYPVRSSDALLAERGHLFASLHQAGRTR